MRTPRRVARILAGLALLLAPAGTAIAQDFAYQVRLPYVAGHFYPAAADQLRAAAETYLAEADPESLPGRYAACLAPNASWAYSGRIAAKAIAPIEPEKTRRVIILASSHFARFRGCSLPAVHAFRTPLGDVPVDRDALDRLTISPQFSLRSVVYDPGAYTDPEVNRKPVHEVEHAVEVLLPLLQVHLDRFELVPILVGDFLDYRGDPDPEAAGEAADTLREVMDDETVVILSSNLTHYGYEHGYRPFHDRIITRLAEVDNTVLALLREGDAAMLQAFNSREGGPLQDLTPMQLFTAVRPRACLSVLQEYITSAALTGEYERSVGYAAVGFYDLAGLHPDVIEAAIRRLDPGAAPVRQEGPESDVDP
jgi:hypothetical protein